jgi:hypothetical protein
VILPVDYFDKVLMEFVEVVSQCIENKKSNNFQYDIYEFSISYPSIEEK